MQKRIHPGMSQKQVHRILGKKSGDEGFAMPGDVPDPITDQETYYGQDGPLYVSYTLARSGYTVVRVDRTEILLW